MGGVADVGVGLVVDVGLFCLGAVGVFDKLGARVAHPFGEGAAAVEFDHFPGEKLHGAVFGGKADFMAHGIEVEVQHVVAVEGLQGDGFSLLCVVHTQFVAGRGAQDVLRFVAGGDGTGGVGVGQTADDHRAIGIVVEATEKDFRSGPQGKMEADAGSLPGRTAERLEFSQRRAGLGVCFSAAVKVGAQAVAALFIEPGIVAVGFDPRGKGQGQLGQGGTGGAVRGFAFDQDRFAAVGGVFPADVFACALPGMVGERGDQHVAALPRIEPAGVQAEEMSGRHA